MAAATNVMSTNWSGAAIQASAGHSLSAVSGQWTIPTVSPVPIKGTTMSDVASWVGLDGLKSNDVAQAGIQETVTTAANGHSSVSYSAWDEWYPAGSNTISAASFKVNPGDTVNITVATSGASATQANFLFDDKTTGQTYQSSLTAPKGTSLVGDSAEWVVETPEWSNGHTLSQPPLANFLGSPIVFKDATATYSNGSAANLSSAQTIGMYANGVPGIRNNTQEAYGSVSAATNTVTVTEDDYWGLGSSFTDPFHHFGYFF